MNQRMTNESALNILNALQNIANASIGIKDELDYIAGECTRIMNIYQQYINTDKEKVEDKKIYNLANAVINSSDEVEKANVNLKDAIQELLTTIGNS